MSRILHDISSNISPSLNLIHIHVLDRERSMGERVGDCAGVAGKKPRSLLGKET